MKTTIFAALALVAAPSAFADYRVDVNAVDVKGVGAPLGTVTLAEAGDGVTITPNLHGLPPGEHGFHIHEFANCGAREQDGKMVAAGLAGNHWDPEHKGHHGAPGGAGHRGDLPVLVVGKDGSAKQPVTVHGMKLTELRNKAIVVHAGGDNQSDQPKPNGGGGDRIACGVIQAAEKR